MILSLDLLAGTYCAGSIRRHQGPRLPASHPPWLPPGADRTSH